MTKNIWQIGPNGMLVVITNQYPNNKDGLVMTWIFHEILYMYLLEFETMRHVTKCSGSINTVYTYVVVSQQNDLSYKTNICICPRVS